MKTEEKNYWYKQRLFNHTDSITGNKLSMFLFSYATDKKEWGVEYGAPSIHLQINDIRAGSQAKVKIELGYEHLNTLIENLKKVFSGNVQNIIQTGGNVSIQKYTSKSKKELNINFMNEGGYKACIKISDPTSTYLPLGVINLDLRSFKNMVDLLGNMNNNYSNISTNISTTLCNERILDVLNTIGSNSHSQFNSLREDIKDVRDKFGMFLGKSNSDNSIIEFNQQIIESYKDDHVEDNNISQIEPEEELTITEPTDIQNAFSQFTIDVDSIVLEEPHIKDKIIETQHNFITTFLNNDISKLKSWVTGFLNSADMRPIDEFMSRSMIADEFTQPLTNTNGYQEIQTIVKQYVIQTIKDYLENNITDYPTNIPVMRFGYEINDNNIELYKLGQHMIVVLLIYNIFMNQYMNNFQGNPEQQRILGEYKRTYFIFKVLVSSFISSMVINDWNKFTVELNEIFNISRNANGLINLNDEYNQITFGGNFDINLEMFENITSKFVSVMQKTMAIPFERIDFIYAEYKIKKTASIMIENELAKNLADHSPLEILEEEKVIIPWTTNGTIESVNEQIEKVTEYSIEKQNITPENRMDIFKEIACLHLRDDDIRNKLNEITNYSELTNFFKINNPPDRFFKTKRIMDMYPDINDKVQLKKLIKDFDEDIVITQSRVMQEDTISEEKQPSENFDMSMFG